MKADIIDPEVAKKFVTTVGTQKIYLPNLRTQDCAQRLQTPRTAGSLLAVRADTHHRKVGEKPDIAFPSKDFLDDPQPAAQPTPTTPTATLHINSLLP